MPGLFEDQWVLVTGASSGLGAELARQVASRGAKLVLSARTQEPLDRLATDLTERHGSRAILVTADLADAGGPRRLADAIEAHGIAIDHAFLNAGFGRLDRFGESDGDQQAGMVRLNCEALVWLAHRFLPGMIARRRGGVLLVGSIAGYQPAPYLATYAASKAFVLSFGRALAEELRGSGVRTLVLCPGPVPTGFQAVAGIAPLPPRGGGSVLTAAETVRRGLDAYESGRTVLVTGLVNRLQTWAARLVPDALLVRAVARRLEPGLARREPAGQPGALSRP